MTHEIILQQLGETMEEGIIASWSKKEGEKVAKGETLYEVTTDKATFEAESPVDGFLRKILVPADANQNVPVLTVIGYLTDTADESIEMKESTAVPAPAPTETEAAVEAPPVETAAAKSGRIIASPLAKKLAKQHGVDLATLTGSGPRGRIVKKDVLAAAAEPAAAPAPAAVLEARIEPIKGMRKVIARRMQTAKQEAPHYYLTADFVADELVKLRSDLIGEVKKICGKRLSLNDLIVKGVALGLEEFPQVNAYFIDDQIHTMPSVNVGVAVALTDGLVVPVIRHANRKSISSLVTERFERVERARAGKANREDLSEGTFTVTNLGQYPIRQFCAIINQPQVAILAVAQIADAAVVENGRPVVRKVGHMTLSPDHRAVDGAVGAAFLCRLKEILETPYLLLKHGL